MVRFACEADVPEILEIYAPYIVSTTVSFEYEVPTREEFLKRFRDVTRQYPWLVYEEDGQILGYAYAGPVFARTAYAWCAEPSIYLRPEARGRGIGKKLYSELEKILFLQGYRILYAIVTQENTDSIRFHEKNGYILQAELPDCGYKFNKSLGISWMRKPLNFVQSPSNFPVPWRDVVHNGTL